MEHTRFTLQQLEQANHVDLEEFLLQHGEKLLRSGPEKRMASNHSTTIRGCEWFDHADRQGGKAVSFAQRYLGVSFREAVQILLGGQGIVYAPAQPRKEEPPKPFVLPPAHTDNRRVRAYLEHCRKISAEVLRTFEKEGLIYEDSQYHNAVFVGFDGEGVARHAHKRSTNTQGNRFTINVEGCDPRYSFHWTGSSDTIYVFEAPIDMMSFISMKADWKQHSYVALCGVAEHTLIQQLEEHPQLSNIVLCLDYDKAGIQARKRITQILQERGYHQVSSLLSFTKDWNEDLQRGIVMTEKVREYLTLSQETTVAITQDREKWQSFLRTSGQMCKYSFNDQVLIFAQRPEATACAEYDVWNKTMRRYVKRGAKGIALLDARGDHLTLRHVFDVSDTAGREDSRIVNLWGITDRYVPEVQRAIEATFGVPVDDNTLAEQIEMVATLQWMYKWIDHKQELLDIVDDKMLKQYDESTIQEMFRSAIVSSVTYTVCSRCLKDGPEITANDFRDIAQFASPRMANALGETVTGLNTEIFRVIEHTIKQVEKEERGKNYGNRVQENGRIFHPRSGVNRYGQDGDWTMGADAQTVSGGTQTVRLQHYGDGADPVSPPSGDRLGSSRQDGNYDAAAGQGGGSHGGAEEEGLDEVGGPDEHLQGPSGGDYPGGTDLQLSLLPADAEQIQRIEEAERVANTFSAFSVTQADIDHEPAPPTPAAELEETPNEVLDEHPISIQVNGEWQTFPNAMEAEKAAYGEYRDNLHRNARNFQITDDHLGEGGPKAKFQANIEAIKLLKYLEETTGQATPEQQEVLSRYVGWGGLADAFDPDKESWSKEYAQLKELLTPEEYAAARGSTLNAHYTSPTVIRAIYEAVGRMGFETGNILEPSCGVGNFFGMLPEEMRNSRLYGVELDSVSGRLAQQLYPKADITVAGFETTDRRDFYDLAIGNVPFGQYQVRDKAYNKLNFNIHNYFFAKALDQVRPGGVVAFVTSRYTMDAKDSTVRRYLAQRAELLGAIRLPNNAFKANAGTEVVSDIIFLQKRDRPLDIVPEWTQTGQSEDGFAINRYFLDHPEMVLGRQEPESTARGMDYTVNPIEGLELADQLHDAVKYICGTYQEAELPELGEGEAIDTSIPADPNVKNYSYTVVDGTVYFRENSCMVRPDLNATAEARVKGLVGLRECVQQLIDLQMDAATPDSVIQDKQAELNRLYDSFSAKYGLINDRANRLAFADDSSYYLLCALEVIDEDGKLERKADMFTKRTIKPHKAVDTVDTASEALAVSISEKACVDMAYMSELTGKTGDELAAELQGVIFRLPGPVPEGERPTYVTADEYLSGNVRRKLRQAQRAAQQDSAFAINVEALTAAQPKDLDASEIEVRLGATWIDKEYIQQFMYETFNTPHYLQRTIQINYASYTAEWQVTGKSSVSEKDVAAYTTYGTSRTNAYKILEDSLNLRDVRIYDTVEDVDGKERRVLNAKETTLAAQKQQAIRDAFRDWIWRDPERRQTLVRQYNEDMNSTRPREYDGSHITFGGMNPSITLRDHQLGAIAHILYGGNTLLAHEVGAGKTFEMVAAAMEAKRLGLCQKSLFVVPNHLTEQWASEFLRLYPSAKILVTTKKDFETRNRKKFCARIATGDYDAVIIGHSQFEKIPISRERQERLLQEQIDEITNGIAEVMSNGGERFTVKQLERTKKSLEARLEKLQAEEYKDDVVTFEQLGVDRLFVDEAHNYKNLFLYTKMRNVAGLSTSDAQKSSDMFAKCRYMDEITGSRGVIFATGTPVSNSMTELYTMQRYLQYDRLQELGMTHFDCWASRFGETMTALELAPEGTGYRARTRFSKFFNLPELMNLFKEVADIKTSDQLHLPTPEVEYHNIVAQPTEQQQEMVKALSERASLVHSGTVDPSQDNMLKITSDGRKLGLDQRIINPALPDDPGTKVNQCVANIFRIWQDGQANKLTQLVFCDISTPQAAPSQKKVKLEPVFTIYEDIRQKLIAQGMPADQIAFIHEANTEVRKKELFAKVRTGQVRVLLGSTAKMGAGTNVQDRLVALHDLDCPWRPGDLEQRKGRIKRQGNQNPLVHVYRYVTEGTFDAYLWQTLENKQRFISQIMTSKSPLRSCEDLDETALSFAEIKALCAGDPRIKERMDLDVEVSKLKLMKADHQSKQYRLEDQLLKYFPEEIEKHKGFIQGFEADLETLATHPHPEGGFAGMEIRGDILTDKENAGAALLDVCKEVKNSEPVQIGSYRGFAMSVMFDVWRQEYTLLLKGQMTHRASLGTDPRGNLTRIDNALAQMPQRLDATKAQLDNLHQQQAAAKEEAGKPFPYEEDLRVKSARLVELDTLLNLGNGKDQFQSNSAVTKSARPSIWEHLKEPKQTTSKTPAYKKREPER